MTSKRVKSTFVKNVISLRAKRGWTAMELAEKADLSYPAIRDIEAGINEGRQATKEKIARALDTTVDALNRSPSDVSMGIMELAEAVTKLKRENEVLLNLIEGLRESSKDLLPAELAKKLAAVVPIEVLKLLVTNYPDRAGAINAVIGVNQNKKKGKETLS